YHRLNALMDRFSGMNFTILGFSCNQFGLQAPEENHETLDVLRCVRPGHGFIPKFPMFSKIEESLRSVNPLIGNIKKLYWSPIKVNDIRWNFEKFLITADGLPYRRQMICQENTAF
ncbi:hypothetical protein QTP70_018108, partial [Hemibagrus guttatus]